MSSSLPTNAEFDLTVATVCYNAASCLPRCMAAVQPLLHHESLRVEYLVVDGGSTDGTPALLETALQEGRLTRYISEPDEGIYDAMNKALRLARGRVIVYANADDEVVPGGVAETCAPILRGECSYCVGRVEITDADGRHRGFTRENMDEALLTAPYGHPGLYVATELLRDMGGFTLSPDLRIVADAELMGRLAAAQLPMRFTGSLCARFYQGGVSTTELRTQRETLLMMCRNSKPICAKLATRPRILGRVLRHIRRYGMLIETGTGQELPEELISACRDLLRDIAAVLTPMQRRRYVLQCLVSEQKFRLQAWASPRKAESKRIQARLCRFMAEQLGAA